VCRLLKQFVTFCLSATPLLRRDVQQVTVCRVGTAAVRHVLSVPVRAHLSRRQLFAHRSLRLRTAGTSEREELLPDEPKPVQPGGDVHGLSHVGSGQSISAAERLRGRHRRPETTTRRVQRHGIHQPTNQSINL